MSGRAAGSQGAHRDRRGVRRAEHRQVRAPLRAGGARSRAAAARLRDGGPLRGREGPRRGAASTSAAAPPISSSSPTARSATPRSFRSRATRSPTTSRWRCARRPRTPRRSRSATAARSRSSPTRRRWSKCPGWASAGRAQLSRKTLAEVIEPRVEELYSLVQAELRRSGYEELLSSGVVLTGGSSVMRGMVELGEEIFHMPVRVGARALQRRARGVRAASALSRPGWGCCSRACSSSARRSSRACTSARSSTCWNE